MVGVKLRLENFATMRNLPQTSIINYNYFFVQRKYNNKSFK